MYRVLKNLPTIINYVDQWRTQRCPCGQDIDVGWQPDVGDVDATHWFFSHCPECVIRAAPEDSQQSWRERYRQLRADRVSVGLGRPVPPPDSGLSPTDLSEDARESLRWPSGSMTLHCVTRTEPGTNLVLDQFVILGMITDSLQGRVNPNNLAPFPWFAIQQTAPSEEFPEPVEFAAVILGATVRDTERHDLELRYRWNRFAPAAPAPMDVRGWEYYLPAEVGAFTTKAMEFFQQARGRGAPRGSRIHKQTLLNRYCAIRDGLGKVPTSREFRERYYVDGGSDLDWRTLDKALKQHGWATYREFVKDAETKSVLQNQAT